ncbi:MAG: hypothetical protein ACOYM2_07765 [Rectinemataceae bacterium]
MNNRNRTALSLALLFIAQAISAQLLAPGQALEELQTASFNILFPEGLVHEAERLASFAEEVLAQEVGRIGPHPTERLTVLLTDRFPETNGYYTPLPSTRIVLEVAPFKVNDETSSTKDQLRLLFTHELAHALSLSIRPPLLAVADLLFGDIATGSIFIVPSVLAEGAAIVAESSDKAGGRGRAWDPLAVMPVRQALIEHRPIDFWTANNSGGLFPFGGSAYTWGGPFMAWLEAEYGTGSVQKLFTEFGNLRAPADWLWTKGAFTAAFGRDLDSLWDQWLATMAPDRPVYVGSELLASRPGLISALTAGTVDGKALTIWEDSAIGAVLELSEGDRHSQRLFAADGHVNRLALSGDGRFLLVSTVMEDAGTQSRLAVRVWDRTARAFTKRSIPGLREAAWVGEAGDQGEGPVVGIAPRGIRTDVVRVDGATRSVLAQGTDSRFFGSPLCLGADSLFFLARDEGRSMLIRVEEGRPSVLSPGIPLRRLRFLSGRGNELAIGYANDGGLYRVALLEGVIGPAPAAAPEAKPAPTLLRAQETDISGGVQDAAFAGLPGGPPELHYKAAFSEGEYPAAYPFAAGAMAMKETSASWSSLDASFLGLSADIATASLGSAVSSPLAAARPAPFLPLAGKTFRIPVFSGDLSSGGLYMEGADISETLVWGLDAEYSWAARAANLAGKLGLSIAPYRVSIAGEDWFSPNSESKRPWSRTTRLSLGISRKLPDFPLRNHADLGLELAGGALSKGAAGAAYTTSPSSGAIAARLSLTRTQSHTSPFAPFDKEGFEAGAAADTEWRPGLDTLPACGLSVWGGAWAPFLGLHGSLEANLSPGAGLLFGPGGRGFADGGNSLLDPVAATWPIYSARGQGSWYARAELAVSPLSLEIGAALPLFGIYSRRVMITSGMRAGTLGNFTLSQSPTPLFSAFVDASFEFTVLTGYLAQAGLAAIVHFEYAPLAATPGSVSFELGNGH